MALGFSLILGDHPVLVWGVFDGFWGLHWVSLGFSVVIMLKKCILFVLENFR